MSNVTGLADLHMAELELKQGVMFCTSGCCASGTKSATFLPADDAGLIEEDIDSLDIDALIAELSRTTH